MKGFYPMEKLLIHKQNSTQDGISRNTEKMGKFGISIQVMASIILDIKEDRDSDFLRHQEKGCHRINAFYYSIFYFSKRTSLPEFKPYRTTAD